MIAIIIAIILRAYREFSLKINSELQNRVSKGIKSVREKLVGLLYTVIHRQRSTALFLLLPWLSTEAMKALCNRHERANCQILSRSISPAMCGSRNKAFNRLTQLCALLIIRFQYLTVTDWIKLSTWSETNVILDIISYHISMRLNAIFASDIDNIMR